MLYCLLQKRILRDKRMVRRHLDSTFQPGNQCTKKNQNLRIFRLHKKDTDKSQVRHKFQVCILGAKNLTRGMKILRGKCYTQSCRENESSCLWNMEDSLPPCQSRNFLDYMALDSQIHLNNNVPPNMECRYQRHCSSKTCQRGTEYTKTHFPLNRNPAYIAQ
jgi:hypothetical protein